MKQKNRIFLTVVMFCALFASIFVITAFAVRMPGDVDNDGKITAADARILLRISAKLEKPEDYYGSGWSDAVQITVDSESLDYNDYMIPGGYIAGSTDVVTRIKNKPNISDEHKLFVLETVNGGIMQIIVTNSTSPEINIYRRLWNGESWTDWNIIVDDGIVNDYIARYLADNVNYDKTLSKSGEGADAKAVGDAIINTNKRLDIIEENAKSFASLSASEATKIIASENSPVDYDDYKTPGSFFAGNADVVSHIKNKPNIKASHRLFVLETVKGRIVQIIISNSTKPAVNIYKRLWNGVSWTDWNIILDSHNFTEYLTDNEIFVKYFNNNTKPYYTLNQSDFGVGTIISSGPNAGRFSSSLKYRISTPDIHVAETDLLIRSKVDYRVIIYLFNNGVYAEKLLQPGLEGAKICGGQEYKISIRQAPENTDAVVAVEELYDKALFFNPIQQVSEISKKGEPRYTPADFGIIPKGVFYPGTDDSYDRFTYDSTTQDVYDAFDSLVASDSCYITKTDLGLCSDNIQHVYAYDFNPKQIGNAAFVDNIPAIFIMSGQHGYEKASVFSLYYLFDHMINDTDSNPVLNYLRNHCRIICIPVANPYGFNMKQYKNANGVNLNRNWEGRWEYLDDPTSKDYAGSEPFDQPETSAIRDFFIANESSITFAVDYHTNGREAIKSNYALMNAILTNNEVTPLQNAFKNAIRYHIRDITSHFKTQYSLDITDDIFCGYITTETLHSGFAHDWFYERNKLGCTFETFPGFPGGNTYTPEVIKASEELIGNFIITVFNYIE